VTDEEAAELQQIVDRLVWRPCRPEYAERVGPHEYVVRNQTIGEPEWLVLVEAIRLHGQWRWWSPPGAPSKRFRYRYLLLGEHRYWTIQLILNRARLEDR
jgi:hypothetical protein